MCCQTLSASNSYSKTKVLWTSCRNFTALLDSECVVPHFKGPMFGQLYTKGKGYIITSRFCKVFLKNSSLLHKEGLVARGVATTVIEKRREYENGF